MGMRRRSSLNGPMFGKAGTITMIAGGALLLAGGALLLYSRSRRGSNSYLPPADDREPLGNLDNEATSQTSAGGMTLRHFRGKMPINKRLKILQDLTWKSVQDPRNRKLALEMTRNCPERDGLCEAKAIYQAVKSRVRYTGDVAPVKMGSNGPVEGVDLYQAAHRTWEFSGGDCDDHAVLLATMLTLNGISAKFRVTATGKNEEFSHIYTMAGVPKLRPAKWVALDTTLPGNNNFGREAPYGRHADFPA